MKQKETQQETMPKEKRVVFFEGKSWYHRTKELQDDLTTKYGKKGGFETPEEAEKSYWEYEKRYQKKQRDLQIAKMQKTDVMLGDYLEYWFENIFSPRIETTTRMVGAYTLYNLILPSMEADIKLKYISVEYLDALLERVAKICPSAGNKGRELLSIAMKDAAGDGYQLIQSLYAFGSGGLTGLGLGQSRQKALYMPEPHTDFIFSIIGEEVGLIGCLIIILVFAVLIWKGINIALEAKDTYGSLLAMGIISVIAVQLIVNIAVVTSSMPNTGIPLS